MADWKLEGLLLTRMADIRYICGFSGSSATVLLLRRRGYFLTDSRYREQSAEEVKGLEVLIYREGPGEGLRKILDANGKIGLGFDPEAVSYAEVLSLRGQLKGKARLVPFKGSLASLRARKDAGELEKIRRCIEIAEQSFREVVAGLGSDTTEMELAFELDMEARKRGADDRAFDTIVASGPRGALVHAQPSTRKLRGATVVDWGVNHGGYNSDTSRTLALGRTPTVLRKAHQIVLEAQERALERIKPGARAGEVDAAARETVERAGFGLNFGHGLGHGVGLEVHERPHVSGGSHETLEEGMVFTVEPGIYIPGEGGVRVEDMVLVKKQGPELLTTLPRGMDPSDY